MQARKITLPNIDWQPRPVHHTTGCHHLQVYKSCCLLTHLHYEGESCFLITAKKSGTKLLMQGQKLAALQAFVVAEPRRLTNTWVFLLRSPCLFLRPLRTHYTFMLFNFGVKTAGEGTAECALSASASLLQTEMYTCRSN